jgi:hypothetical protein
VPLQKYAYCRVPVLCGMTLCSYACCSRHFEGYYCLHLPSVQLSKNNSSRTTWCLKCLFDCLTLGDDAGNHSASRTEPHCRRPEFSQTTLSELQIRQFEKQFLVEKRLLVSSYLSVRPHETTRLPVDGFSWNLIFEYFSKVCPENSSFIKLWQ